MIYEKPSIDMGPPNLPCPIAPDGCEIPIPSAVLTDMLNDIPRSIPKICFDHHHHEARPIGAPIPPHFSGEKEVHPCIPHATHNIAKTTEVIDFIDHWSASKTDDHGGWSDISED